MLHVLTQRYVFWLECVSRTFLPAADPHYNHSSGSAPRQVRQELEQLLPPRHWWAPSSRPGACALPPQSAANATSPVGAAECSHGRQPVVTGIRTRSSPRRGRQNITGPLKERLLQYIRQALPQSQSAFTCRRGYSRISKLVGIVKANSSEWVCDTLPEASVAPCGGLDSLSR